MQYFPPLGFMENGQQPSGTLKLTTIHTITNKYLNLADKTSRTSLSLHQFCYVFYKCKLIEEVVGLWSFSWDVTKMKNRKEVLDAKAVFSQF